MDSTISAGKAGKLGTYKMVMMNESLQKAVEARNSERFEEALSILEALYKENPDDPLINYHYAWTYDRMGRETSAVPYYVRAIENGLPDEDLRGALLGLGSTYRTIGEFEKAVETLQRGKDTFPDAPEFPVFLSMALYNVGQAKEGMSMLLTLLVENTSNQGILRLRRAIVKLGGNSALVGVACPNEGTAAGRVYLFKEGDVVLICPNCKTPHHLSCWTFNEHQCMQRTCEVELMVPVTILESHGLTERSLGEETSWMTS